MKEYIFYGATLFLVVFLATVGLGHIVIGCPQCDCDEPTAQVSIPNYEISNYVCYEVVTTRDYGPYAETDLVEVSCATREQIRVISDEEVKQMIKERGIAY